MKSPFTGKDMILHTENRVLSFRKEEFNVKYQFFKCEDTQEQFTSTEIDEVNLVQVHNQYRVKHNLPFAEEIKAIREKYSLSAVKMAEVLGFGVNMYRAYENGEIPSNSNARLIQLANDPNEFQKLVELSNVLEEKETIKVQKKINELLNEKSSFFFGSFENYMIGNGKPDEFTGFKKPSIEKLTEMVVFFAERIKPWKTQLNKLLFYVDFLNCKNTGYSISGMQYCAIDLGPVPNQFQSLFEYMHNSKNVDIKYHQFENGNIGEQFIPNNNYPFNNELFTETELNNLDKVANHFKDLNTRQIVDISHNESAWIDNYNNGKKIISYNYSFELKALN